MYLVAISSWRGYSCCLRPTVIVAWCFGLTVQSVDLRLIDILITMPLFLALWADFVLRTRRAKISSSFSRLQSQLSKKCTVVETLLSSSGACLPQRSPSWSLKDQWSSLPLRHWQFFTLVESLAIFGCLLARVLDRWESFGKIRLT